MTCGARLNAIEINVIYYFLGKENSILLSSLVHFIVYSMEKIKKNTLLPLFPNLAK
jgi:hypothetical protein